MIANRQFRMRVSDEDKAMLKSVANHFHRSQADTLKTLVREVYEVLKDEMPAENKTPIGDPPIAR